MKNSHANWFKSFAALLCAVLISACGGGSGGAGSASLKGTAAIGSAITGATVTAICADGSGFAETVTTNADGSWSGAISSAAVLPCALQVSGGTPNITLHSVATRLGNVNITPLTDLALALQINTLSGQGLSDWFAAPNTGGADLSSLSGALVSAADTLRAALLAANFILPTSWSAGSTAPFSTPFSANPNSDPYDRLLEKLAEAVDNDPNVADHAALVGSMVAGGTLPTAPSEQSGGTSPAEINAALISSKSMVFKVGGGEGCGSLCGFSEDQVVSVIIGADNSLTVDGKKLVDPFHRIFATAPHLPEIIWKDGDIEYALSDNESGDFNEINVGDSARPLGPFNVPTFIGQLREDVPLTPAATLIGPLAGTYNPVIVAKSSTYTGNSPLPVGGGVEVVVSSNGVVTIDGYTFDPDEASYEFSNQTLLQAAPELYYGASIKESETINFSLAILVDPIDKQPVAWRLTRTVKLGPGSYAVRTLDLEERPIPQAATDFFTDLQALGAITLTLVQHPGGYHPIELCQQEVLTIEGDGSAANPWGYDLNPPGVSTPGAAVGQHGWDIYRRSYSRYSETSGTRQVALKNRGRDLVMTDDGKVTVVSRNYQGTITARSTTDADQINSACPE